MTPETIGRSAYESIREMVAALECDYARLEDLRGMQLASLEEQPENEAELFSEDDAEELAELQAAAGDCTSREDAEQRIQEDALSVEIRSGWVASPYEDDGMKPEDFRILLTTGGPAVQIRGELDEYNEPRRAWLEVQDWGTPWTEHHGEYGTDTWVDQDVLLTYARQFYYGG